MLSWLFKETLGRLQSLERSVADGRAVEEASNYARWLNFSGLVKIFEAYPQAAPFLVDAKLVRDAIQRVTDATGAIFKGGRKAFDPATARVDEINAKLDVVLSQLARGASQPALHVVQIGDAATRAGNQ